MKKPMNVQSLSTMFSWYSHKAPELFSQRVRKVGLMPEEITADAREYDKTEFDLESIGKIAETSRYSVSANWYDHHDWQISLYQPNTIKESCDLNVDSTSMVFDQFKNLPFDIGIGSYLYSPWLKDDFTHQTYLLPEQYPLGWLLALKSDGYKYIVSKRWFDYAPVHVIEKNNTLFIQCHDIRADTDTALTQAIPAWSTVAQGFLTENIVTDVESTGLYDPEQASLSITVIGRDISLQELRNVCTARNFHGLADSRPIKKLVYVFMEPERAYKHLHELWLREIDCHTFIDGKEVNLCITYTPPVYSKPDWVKKL